MFGIRQATSVFRGLRRQKGYIIINIAGLAVGLASAMLIALWVGDERGSSFCCSYKWNGSCLREGERNRFLPDNR
jgi:hypothetical protein